MITPEDIDSALPGNSSIGGPLNNQRVTSRRISSGRRLPTGSALPQVTVHRIRGLIPKVTVRRRIVVDYQPSWLVVAVPAALALWSVVARRKRSAAARASASSSASASMATPDSAGVLASPAPLLNVSPMAVPTVTPGQRRRPAKIVVLKITGMRRRRRASSVVKPVDLHGAINNGMPADDLPDVSRQTHP